MGARGLRSAPRWRSTSAPSAVQAGALPHREHGHRRRRAADRGPAGLQRRVRVARRPLRLPRHPAPTHRRRPAEFRAGGTPLVLLWWAFAATAVLLASTVVLLSSAIADADPTLLIVSTTLGVLAALVQLPGLVRWPILVPQFARAAADPDASEARREAVDIVFQSFNRYLGVAVGEHLGYALTGVWTTLSGIASRGPPPPLPGSGSSGSSSGPSSCSARWSSSAPTSGQTGSSPNGSRRSPTSPGRFLW